MNRKRLIGLGIVICICAGIVVVGKTMDSKEDSTILDNKGNIVATLYYHDGELRYKCDDRYDAYIDIASKDLIDIVMDRDKLSENAAKKKIARSGFRVHTALDGIALDRMEQGCENSEDIADDKYAALMSDNSGKVIACYSHSKDMTDYVDKATYAGSTMKPLSVYAPGIEKGQITWSSMFEDSPYTQLKNENGQLEDWPHNTKDFTNEPVTVAQALKESNNAVAVKTLKKCGVSDAGSFLSDKLGLDISKEQELIKKEGEDSILANIALGYLEDGITMRELQSDYLMFANGGRKYSLYTIESIEADQKEYYKHKDDGGEQVISAETAYIMNRMLAGVVSEGGTGEAAALDNVEVCGKTGTSRDFKDNWFVGMTPEYTCTVWYEEKNEEIHVKNESPIVFQDIMKQIHFDTSKGYPTNDNVKEISFCKKTGLQANEHCVETETGYYNKQYVPDICTCE